MGDRGCLRSIYRIVCKATLCIQSFDVWSTSLSTRGRGWGGVDLLPPFIPRSESDGPVHNHRIDGQGNGRQIVPFSGRIISDLRQYYKAIMEWPKMACKNSYMRDYDTHRVHFSF